MAEIIRYNLATISGDGIGPEVMEAAISVLEALSDSHEVIEFYFVELQAGVRVKAETGTALPP